MLKVAEIIKATGGKLVQGVASLKVTGVSTDTRTVGKGDLFIAIRGERFDGHDYAVQAVAGGAVALLVSRGDAGYPPAVTVIRVDDTLKALGLLAAFYRLKFKIPVIAITGSAGKTTTKEFIAAVLGKKFRVLFNKGTLNNHIGVPMTLLQLKKTHQAAVIEAGTNHFGEISWLGGIIRPTIAVFTNIGQSHLAGLESPEGVFKEKVTLLDHLASKGTVIMNNDDTRLRAIPKMKPVRHVVTFGIDQKADIKARAVRADGKGLVVELEGGKIFRLPAPVWGNVSNALAAVACGLLLKVPFKKIAAAIEQVEAPKGRQCFYSVMGVTVVDDTYNANPVSYYNAIKTLTLVRSGARGRTFLVAADMLELGDQSEALHADVGEAVARAGIDHLLTIGRWAGIAGEKAKELSPAVWTKHYLRQEDIFVDLGQMLKTGDVLLVKGSRGMRMDQLVEQLLVLNKMG
ncbi:MAG: UDP-N-acetylmuramoyl-tripeptide--D-alanyl-D-alanine ligase [Candidatus Omnitrophota bacterium]